MLLDRPGFHEQCEHWKSEHRVDGVYKDIYDGKVWKGFQTYSENPS